MKWVWPASEVGGARYGLYWSICTMLLCDYCMGFNVNVFPFPYVCVDWLARLAGTQVWMPLAKQSQ